MGDVEQSAITVECSPPDYDDLLRLLWKHPQLSHFPRGVILKKVAIVGPPEAIKAIRPELDAWRKECESRDAW